MSLENFFENVEFTSYVWQIITPLIFNLGDILTGYIQAIINKNLDSKKMRIGLLRKFLLIIIVILANIMQFAFNMPFISSSIAIYIIFMEVISILENLKKAGLNLGKFSELLEEKGVKKDD